MRLEEIAGPTRSGYLHLPVRTENAASPLVRCTLPLISSLPGFHQLY